MLGEEERSDEEGSFSKASIPKRILVVLAGGLVNIIFGLVVYFILVSSTGNYITTTIDTVSPGFAAEEVGIARNDEIIKINNKRVRLRSDIEREIQKSNGKQITFEIKKDNSIKEVLITPTKIENKYVIGVTFKVSENSFKNNIYYGFWDTAEFSTSIVENLKEMFSGRIKADQLMGPVGISEVVSKTQGVVEFVYMLALISLSLGVTNLLPFPPLDGGKVVLLIIEWVRKKPIKEELELKIQMAGFALLIALSIYVTYNDVLRIFK